MKRIKLVFAIAIAGLALIMTSQAFAQESAKRKGQRKSVQTATPVANQLNSNLSTPSGKAKTPSQFGADMLEGTNIRRKQTGHGKQVQSGIAPTIPATSSAMTTASSRGERKPNRRKFDHLGNVKAAAATPKKPPTQFGADMMEGNNIRRKQPGRHHRR